jgi:hypothetical protein
MIQARKRGPPHIWEEEVRNDLEKMLVAAENSRDETNIYQIRGGLIFRAE